MKQGKGDGGSDGADGAGEPPGALGLAGRRLVGVDDGPIDDDRPEAGFLGFPNAGVGGEGPGQPRDWGEELQQRACGGEDGDAQADPTRGFVHVCPPFDGLSWHTFCAKNVEGGL